LAGVAVVDIFWRSKYIANYEEEAGSMHVVTDLGSDHAPGQIDGLNIHFVPLRINLDGKSYVGGIDLSPKEFYKLLEGTESFPTTSQPSAGDFAQLYRELAKTDPEILSIHMSSGLSGTFNSARAGAAMVPEANVTLVDSKTLSCPLGWQVEAAARAVQAGWSKEKIITTLTRLQAKTEGLFTLSSLKYLIHGGRISHLKGLLASLLNIKPVIGVEKERGTYISLGQEVTFKRAIQKLADVVGNFNLPGASLRVQLLHGDNLEGLEILRQKLCQTFDCHFDPIATVAPVLGAHTGPSLVGMAVAPMEAFIDIPR
jgi:DegV family protein with EDD domain